MTLYDFIALNETQQAEATWEGVFLGHRQDEEHKVLLYAIDAFYVEVYYHSNLIVIRKIRAFSSTTLLKPYLRQIDILEVLKLF